MTLGEKIQDLRRKSGMSQDVLAEKLEVSRQAVSKWERDEAVPETDKVVRIAQLFSVSTDDLLLEAETPRPQIAEESKTQSRQERPSTAERVERFVRRHGYKGGFLLMGGGGLISALCLIFRGVWCSAVSGMTESFGNAVGSMGDGLGSGFGSAALPGSGMWGSAVDGMFGGVQDAADSMGQMARDWGNIFLVGLIPGVILIALGIAVLIKGKQIAKETQ